MDESGLPAALAKANAWIDEVEGVVAVGEGQRPDGAPAIDVWVVSAAEAGDLPQEVDGYPVQVRETGGPVTAQ